MCLLLPPTRTRIWKQSGAENNNQGFIAKPTIAESGRAAGSFESTPRLTSASTRLFRLGGQGSTGRSVSIGPSIWMTCAHECNERGMRRQDFQERVEVECVRANPILRLLLRRPSAESQLRTQTGSFACQYSHGSARVEGMCDWTEGPPKSTWRQQTILSWT